MIEQLLQSVVPTVVQVIELIGVAIISIGALVTLVQFAVSTGRGTKTEEAVGMLRSNLGRAILVGLELLVAADIIHTVLVELTLESVAALAGIVIIRTLLSFSLEAEIDGQWPWQRGQQRASKAKQ
ncbi:MAG TPA: DUF1622 domain-containing protein [Sphingomicrobium sp.]|nr:DUF1622 domain-containing protein [Sphingomicrobium sp.]